MKSNFAVDGRTHAEYRKTKSEMQDWLVAQKIMQENLKEDEQPFILSYLALLQRGFT
jgi:hypothetical protein